MMKKIRNIFVVFVSFMLLGCDLGQFTQSKELDDFVISITNDPHPIIINEPVKFYATLRRAKSGVTGCKTTMSKVVRDGLKSENEEALAMPENSRSGIYMAKNVIFAQPGEWLLTFHVDCAGRKREASFPILVTRP